MTMINYSILFCCFLQLCSCKSDSSSLTKNDSTSHSVSDTYQAADFTEDSRRDQISRIADTLHRIMEDHAKEIHIPGLAYGLVVDNELVLASSTGQVNLEKEIPTTTTSSFRIASMTKSFTALAILKLRDEGALSLEDPVADYIPEMSSLVYLTQDAPVIDVENLLTMTAGFPEDNPWGDRQLDEPDQMLLDLLTDGVSFSNPTSHQFEYSNTGFALLGHIISRVSGIPYQDYITEQILQPLGMHHTYWEYDSVPLANLAIGYRWENDQWTLEPMLHDGAYGAMGGLITSIEDFANYVSFHLSAWPPRSEADGGPVKRSSVREMHTPQFSSLISDASDLQGNRCPVVSGYGFGLGISEDCRGLKRISHGGALPGFGSNYVMYPEYGLGIMAFCNLTYTSPWPLQDILRLLFEQLDLQQRTLPVSDILIERQNQVTELIQTWDPELEAIILAENFYKDQSRNDRMEKIQAILEQAGTIQVVGMMKPRNQLRGSYSLTAENGVIEIFFTLSPESNPKVQRLNVSFKASDQ